MDVVVPGVLDLEMQALGEREHGVLAHDVGRLQRHHGHTADRRQIPHPRRGACVDHPRYEGPDPVEDTADVDVDDPVPVVHRCVPQVAELLDACVVDQQSHGSDVAIRTVGELLDGGGVAHVAHNVYRRATGGGQLVTERGDCGAVDIGEYDRHAERAGMSGQAGADAGAGAADDGDAAIEWCAHAPATAEFLALYSANGIESSASSTTLMDVNTSP